MDPKKYFFFFLVLINLLSGCGYQFSSNCVLDNYKTINIPYIDGDKTGGLTGAIIKEIGISSTLAYVNKNADLVLLVEIIDYCTENVGFRYDRDKESEVTSSLIPTETRIFATAEVQLIDECTGCSVISPFRVSASVDFDHDYYNSTDGVNKLSLGQLTDYDAAYDASITPLNRKLAEKVVNYITNYW